ncbi:cyclodeaminase [Roseibium aggregatum]|uniref:Cyclodeaminase n=1 Tax=Roseibium aggregatum TaxID=187304 RepID=A0A939EGV2_9HYPH|nr:cyclodeaminase [Roseibium aggregatum]MBN9672961.1 cyclodeaminase [Roseibium aggregatum]
MPAIKILSETQLRQFVRLNMDTVDCVENAFKALADGGVVMPPILSMAIEDVNGEVDVKTAYVPGVESFAIKVSPGFFDNPKLGLPSTSGLMVLFSARTGMVEALFLDNGYLTDIRTAAAGAVAAKHLAAGTASKACIVGAGTQAKLQLQALCLVRPITEATVWARDFDKARTMAEEMGQLLGIAVSPAADLAEAVGRADVIVTTTPSAEPLIKADWLRPGQHITAMGSDQEHKNELDPACLARADLYVPDRKSQTELLGELHHALAGGVVSSGTKFAELGDIAACKSPGRKTAEDITIADLTGTGVQDTAIATYARRLADAAGAGTQINT